MAKGKRTGASHSGYYANYKNGKRWEKNRLRKLEKQLKEQPGNEKQIKAAMSRVSYRRKTPSNKVWSASKRRIAELFKMFVGRVPAEALLAQMPKGKEAEQAYWKAMNAFSGERPATVNSKDSMYSIMARATIKVKHD